MKIIVICALIYLFFQALYGVFLRGFPAYEKLPQIGYWDSLFASGFIEPYGRIIVAFIIATLIYSISKSFYTEKFLAKELTFGTVTSISYSNTRVNNKPLVNFEIKYLELTGIFKDQPGDFGFEFKKGDIIPVKYQKDKPEVAVIPADAIEIIKNQPSNE